MNVQSTLKKHIVILFPLRQAEYKHESSPVAFFGFTSGDFAMVSKMKDIFPLSDFIL